MVKINGELFDASGMKVSEYLQNASYDAKRVAVELNGAIVPKAKYDGVTINDGDEIEIVSFVGGG